MKRLMLATCWLSVLLTGCKITSDDKKSDSRPAPKRISGDLVVTFPPEGSNLGGKAKVTSVSGYVDSIVKGDNQQSDVDSIMVNGVEANWNPKRKGYWTADIPVVFGKNEVNVILNGGKSAQASFLNQISDFRVERLFYRSSSDRWVVSTYQGWLIEIDLKSKNFQVLFRPEPSEKSFNRYSGFVFSEDQNQLYMWEETQSKLLRYSFQDKKAELLWQDDTKDKALPTNRFVKLAYDDNTNRVFILSTNELFEYSISSDSLKRLRILDGQHGSTGSGGCPGNIHFNQVDIYSLHVCDNVVTRYNPESGLYSKAADINAILTGKDIVGNVRSSGNFISFVVEEKAGKTAGKDVFSYSVNRYDVTTRELSSRSIVNSTPIELYKYVEHKSDQILYLDKGVVFDISSGRPVLENLQLSRNIDIYNMYADKSDNLKVVAKEGKEGWGLYRLDSEFKLNVVKNLGDSLDKAISGFSTRPQSGNPVAIITTNPAPANEEQSCIARKIDFEQEAATDLFPVNLVFGCARAGGPISPLVPIPNARAALWRENIVIDDLYLERSIYTNTGKLIVLGGIISNKYKDAETFGSSLPLSDGRLLYIGLEKNYLITQDKNQFVIKKELRSNLKSGIHIGSNYLFDELNNRYLSYLINKKGTAGGDLPLPIPLSSISISDEEVTIEQLKDRSSLARHIAVLALDKKSNRLVGYDLKLNSLIITNLDSGDQALLPVVFNQ